ncbi:MAG TPA: membrane protein insertase YidC [Candidatus Tectomicrobia bacterium]
MEKRAVLAIVLSLVVVVLWSLLFAPSPPPPPSEVSEPAPRSSAPRPGAATSPAAPSSPGSVTSAARTTEQPPGSPVAPEVPVIVDTGVARLTLTSQGASVREVQLNAYHTTLAKGAPPVEIAPVPGSTTLPLNAELSIEQRVTSLGQVVFTPSQTEVTLSASQPEGTVAFRGELGDGRTVHRLYRFHHTNYTFEVSTWIEGLQPPARSSMLLLWGPGLLRHTDDVNRQGQTGEHPRSYVSGKVVDAAPKKPGETHIEQGQVAWTALADTYFAAVLMPQEPAGDAIITRRLEGDRLEIGLRTPLTQGQARQTVRVYVGPKSQPILETVEPSLDKLIDLGFFSPLARPMLQFLRLLDGWVHNYGLTIILATTLIKIAFWPLTQTSYKSMQAMQKLQPKLKELQVVYKDDRQGLNRAMMQLYREHKINPMGGCLPMVLQIPVFFAFYNALLYSIELRHAPFVCWDTELWWIGRGICDLSIYDPSYITPVLMGVTMFIQQKMTPVTGDPMQAKIMQFMPLMFLVFFLKAPAGLVIYWLINNVLSIAQQMLINRTYSPDITKTAVISKG